jgi:hypothetical protein
MEILPPRPLNRRAYRAVGAEVRRMDRGAPAATSSSLVIPLLDQPPKHDEAQRYAPFMQLLGRTLGDERLVQFSRAPTGYVINRANSLAGMTAKVVGVMSGGLESRLAAVTTPAFAPIVIKSMNGLKKHGLQEEEALAGALALGFFEGIVAQKTSTVSPQRDGYEVVLGRVLGAMDRKQQLSGLGFVPPGAGAAAAAAANIRTTIIANMTEEERLAFAAARPFGMRYPFPAATQASAVEFPPFLSFVSDGDTAALVTNIRNQVQSGRTTIAALTKSLTEVGPGRSRLAAWLYLSSPAFQKYGMAAFTGPDGAYVTRRSSQTVFSAATAFENDTKAFVTGKTPEELVGILQSTALIQNDPDLTVAVAARAAMELYHAALGKMRICVDPTIFNKESWIVNTQCAVDTQTCRDDKIRFVRNALTRVLPYPPTACDINYYTRFGVGPDSNAGETWDDFIIKKEAEGRPPHTVDDINAGGGGQTLDYLFNWVIDLVKSTVGFVNNLLCRVFKAIFGKEFGGILCKITDFLLKLAIGGAVTLLAVMRDVAKMFVQIGEALALPVDGIEKTVRVLMAISSGLNNVVMNVLGTSIAVLLDIPITDDEYRQARQAAVSEGKNPDDVLISVQMLSARLTQKQPMFAISFISSIIGLGSSVFGGIKGLAAGIAGVLNASADAMGVLLGPWLRSKYADLKGFALETVEAGIAVLTKILGTVIAGVLTLYDMFDQMKTKYSTWLASDAGKKVAGAKSWADVRKPFWDSCLRMWSIVQTTAKSLFKPPPPNEPGGLKALMIEFGVCVGIMAIILIAMAYSPDPLAVMQFGTDLVANAATTVTGVVLVTEGQFAQLEQDIGDSCAKLRDEGKPMPALCSKVRVPEQVPPEDAPPADKPPADKPPAKKTGVNLGPALALAAGGALVGGPIGAAGGFIIGFVGSLPKKAKA